MLTWESITANAVAFSKRWAHAQREEAEAQAFEREFLAVFGVTDALAVGAHEYRVPLEDGHLGYIDYYWQKKIAIEMKSRGKDLKEAYAQLRNYVFHLPAEDMPNLLMVSDFETIVLYTRTTGEKVQFKTKDLRKHVKRFAPIAGYETTRTYDNQVEVNVKAAEKMATLHDELKTYGYDGHDLEVYLVRLLFCLFADDTDIFQRDSFTNYIENSNPDGSDLAMRLAQLFEVLNLSPEMRRKRTLLSQELLQFRYINGGLFAHPLPFAGFNAKMRTLLLDCCNFDWNKISPAIFGAMFQGVMDKTKRRELGAHYTGEENILKLINPLFLDELWQEFERVKAVPAQLDRFHNKIAALTFLDPACGCGNFLIITYRELRLLELEILKMKVDSAQMELDISHLLKVSVEQFHGIEHEDFPCQIAQVGMWLMDHQMNLRVAEAFGCYYARLPLTQTAHITHANALTSPWQTTDYILGNPPFVGRRFRTPAQIAELAVIFPKAKDLDYVCAWYKLAADKMMEHPTTRAAFVSTNSITQGEQPAMLWRNIPEAIKINFGIPTFKWSNEAKGKAAVHCVIVGFSLQGENKLTPYLTPGERNAFIEAHSKPLCDAPLMINGNVPLDGDALKVEPEDLHLFEECPWIKRLIGGRELLHNEARYVLWLVNAAPSEVRKYPNVMQRIEQCRDNRLAMKDKGTQALAKTPMTFRDTNNPQNYIALPMVSSEKRYYLPMAYLTGDTIPTNQVQVIPDATLYHFGVLTSSVHNAWMRAVAGRLEMRYRYSKDIVYNNFPWPEATEEQRAKIEQTAQAILEARAAYPDCSLADLYDPLTMPPALQKAHAANDRAVMAAYGKTWEEESAIVADLMHLYQKLLAAHA